MEDNKILLVLPPFWTPLIPPQGIAALKNFLQQHGYKVKTVDANVEDKFKEIYEAYFNTLKEFIPGNKQGNFLRVGHELLRNHMMAHIHYSDENEYTALVKLLINKTYYVNVESGQVTKLNTLLERFYVRLEHYFIDLLEKENPAVLGLSATVGTLPASMHVFQITKKRYPHIMTVMGGCVFSWGLPYSPDFEVFLQKTPYIDKIIIGEGELLFLKLLRGELDDSQRVYTLQDIDNETVDISTAGIPDLSDFDLRHYPYLAAFGSYGCPFQCDFCIISSQYGEYRKKSISMVASEMVTLYQKYKSQLFFMNDSLLNPILTGLSKELLKSPMSFYMDGFLRVDDAVGNPDNTLLWRRGGLYRARLGLESGSQRVLDLMNKKITLPQSKAALSSLALAGIKTSIYLVVGFPGETEADFQQTLDLLEELKNDIWQVDCTPFMYHYTGQGGSDEWSSLRKPLYPSRFGDMLITQTWVLDCSPSREETYHRMYRLVQHCQKLGIPNPLSLNEHYQADLRWKQLHENAVPAMVDFKNNGCIDENKKIEKLIFAQKTFREEGDFMF